MATRLRRVYDKAAHIWSSLHVERHGTYSVERLHSLHKYQESTSLIRAWTVVVLTPLPCLATITLTDAIPLQSPSLGLASSYLFWLRVYVTHWGFILSIMVQLHHLAPRLAVTTAQLLWVSSFVSTIGTAITFVLALLIGYPLPFFFVLTAPGMCAGLMLCIFVVWGQFLKSHADVRAQVLNYYTLLIKNTMIMYTYALFNAAFSHLSSSPSAQTAMTLLLPVIKLAAKNWIYVNVQHMGCFKIEMLIFNIEIFHALYVVFFMQSATSGSTVAVLVFLDAVQACVTLRRVMRLAGFARMSVRLADATRYWSRRVVPLTADTRVNHKDPQLIQLALFILETDPDIIQGSGVRAPSSPSEAHIAGSPEAQQHSDGSERQTAPITATLSSNNLLVLPSPSPVELQHQITLKAPQSVPPCGILLTEDEKRIVRALPAAERCEKVYNALQLLLRTEFIVLVEYVELMIPFVYCLYLLAMSHLSNRIYYAQLCHLTADDEAQLGQKMLNIFLYALLELLSFLVLSWLLGRTLRVSAVHQLAFVLERQWRMAQAKLFFWVMFTVQSSLQHFGNDYSFQFKWLQHLSPT